MKTTILALLLTTASHAALVHQYELNGSFADTFSGPSLVPGGPGGVGTLDPFTYTFGGSQGLSLSGALPSNATYSILMDFKFTAPGSYKKVVDFKNLSSDAGLYSYTESYLAFYPVSSGTTGMPIETWLRLVITRDATDTFTCYKDGALEFSFADPSGLAVFSEPGSIIQFLNDDGATAGFEAVGGVVDRIEIYDDALTSTQVANLGGPAIPEPASAALLLLGAALCFPRRRTVTPGPNGSSIG